MPREITKTIRFQILNRDGNKCVVCGRDTVDEVKLHVDHIHPVAEGGTDNLDNLQTLCNDCNSGKSNFILRPKNPQKVGIPVPAEYAIDQTIQSLDYYRNSTKTNQLTLDQLVAVVNCGGATDGVNPLFFPLSSHLILSACLTLDSDNKIKFDKKVITILKI